MEATDNCLHLTWLGHAAFLLEAAAGLRVLLDPYQSPAAGAYGPIHVPADVVLVSHLNPKYHSHWEAATGTPVRLNGLDFADQPEGRDAHGISFRAVKVWESPERVVPVSMPYFVLDGLSICHSGDLGHALTPGEAAPIYGVDIFLAVAGGPPTLTLPDLRAAIDLIQPRLVIPMHYGNGKTNLPLQPIEEFLDFFAPWQIVHHPSSTLSVSPQTLPAEMRVVVLPSAL